MQGKTFIRWHFKIFFLFFFPDLLPTLHLYVYMKEYVYEMITMMRNHTKYNDLIVSVSSHSLIFYVLSNLELLYINMVIENTMVFQHHYFIILVALYV